MSDDSRLPSSERTYRTVKGVVANLVDSLEAERDQLAREVERLTLHADVAQKHIDAVTDRYNQLRAALLYWRDECSGREPSLSVFERMVDHALSGETPMSNISSNEKTDPREWLIRKRGYYYRPNRSGYTASVDEAGRYTETEAKTEAAIEPWHMAAVHQSAVEPIHSFKNFHRQLCERFGYAHDEVDWQRDQVSLIEHIAKRLSGDSSAPEACKPCSICGSTEHSHLHCYGPVHETSPRPKCEECKQEIDPDWCWCGDAIEDHKGMSHNHSPVRMGCTCGMRLPPLTQETSEELNCTICGKPLDDHGGMGLPCPLSAPPVNGRTEP